MVGQRINKYLTDNGIRKSFVAERAGISRSKMTQICSERNRKVDAVVYYRICKALHVPLETFLEGE